MTTRDTMGAVARRVRSGQSDLGVRPSGSRRPPLRPVPLPASTAPRAPFVALVVLVLGIGLVGLVLLSTSLQHGAFVVQDLESTNAQLRDHQEALVQYVTEQESPEVLAERARGLGMVPSPRRAFIRLPDGTVIGEAQKAKAAIPLQTAASTAPDSASGQP